MRVLGAILLLAAAEAQTVPLDQRDVLKFSDVWCVEDADCQLQGDLGARCNAKNACECGPTHGFKEWGSVETQQCFPKHQTIVVTLKFTGQAQVGRCRDINTLRHATEPREVAAMDRLSTIVQSYTGGRITALVATCIGNDHVFTATIAVPSTCLSNDRDTCQDSFTVGSATNAVGNVWTCYQSCTNDPACKSWSFTPALGVLGETSICRRCHKSTPLTSVRKGDNNQQWREEDAVLGGPARCPETLNHQRRWNYLRTGTFNPATAFTNENSNFEEVLNRELARNFDIRTNLVSVKSVNFQAEASFYLSGCQTRRSSALSTNGHEFGLPRDIAARGSNCQPARCPVGRKWTFTTADRSTANCQAVVANDPLTNSCLYDGDCSWQSLRSRCVDKQCLAQPVFPQRKLRGPSPFYKHWCTKDKDCQFYGDLEATCAINEGLGNWCQCGTNGDFAYPAPYLAMCMRKGATTIPFTYTVEFADTRPLLCPLSQDKLDAVRLLVSRVLGVETLQAFQSFCNTTGTRFMGSVDLSISTANEYAGTSTDQHIFRHRLTKELLRARGIPETPAPATPVPAAAPGRAAAALQATTTAVPATPSPTVHEFESLGDLVFPSLALLGTAERCVSAGALTTGLDRNGVCQALLCAPGYTLYKDNRQWDRALRPMEHYECRRTITAVPAPPSSDDDLSSGELTGLIVGVISGVVIIIAIIAFIVWKSRMPAPVEGTREEMEPVVKDEE